MTPLRKVAKKIDYDVRKTIRETERAFARAPEDRMKILKGLMDKYAPGQVLPPTTGIVQTDAAHEEDLCAFRENLNSENGTQHMESINSLVDDAHKDPLDKSLKTLVDYTQN
ncbi:unnamed protein product [Clonostachys rosea]|uniref:Uncharacterized protein n=1 Tax=Bionectria ochroleuca TaxID=29856 RepID=A0ABY6UR60_BIOOC|nr:unnamed protein product [Clonostachys rosea]